MSAQVTQFFVEVLGILRDASASVHSERRDCWTASPGDVFDKVKAAADRACAPDGGAAEVRAALEETDENVEALGRLVATAFWGSPLDEHHWSRVKEGYHADVRRHLAAIRSLAASQTPPGGSDRG